MAKPDIELLFGVAMGGPSGNSGDTIKGQLEGIIKEIEPLKVKVEIDTDGVIKKWSKDLETILGADGKTIDIKVSKIDASAAIAGFKADLQKIVNSVGVDAGMEVIVRAPNIEEVKTDLKQLGENARASATDVDKLTAEMRELRLQAGSISSAYKKITNTTAESIGGLDIAEITKKYTALQTEIEAMNRVGATSANAHIAKVRELEAEMRKMLATASSGEVDFGPGSDANEAALIRVRNLIADITKNLNEWSAASKGAAQSSFNALSNYRDELSRIETSLNNGTAKKKDFDQSFSRIATGVSSARKEIRAAGEATKSWADKMGGLINKFTSWLSVAEVITTIWHTMQKMADCVVEVDTAMTELKKVTDASDATYDRFLTNATNRARELGSTLTDVVNASADFARLGYGIGDASELADAAILYKNVADGITDIGVASESIISTMQAFKVETSDVTSIVDKFNEVSNNYAISSAGIGEALQRSAAALAAGGNTLDQSIAMITAANRIVQAPESVGTTMKTVSMYLRSAKTELEAAGESTEGMAESTSKLRSELLALTGGAVDIQFDDENFKSTYQILKELSAVWDKLTDVSKANILEKIGGKRNANVVAALIENFDEAERVIETSANSAGSALAENEKYLDSISGRIEKLKASFEGFSASVIDSGLAKFFVSLADSILQIATVFSNVAFDNIFTTFSTIATGAGITAFVKSLDSLSKIGNSVNGVKKIIDILNSTRGIQDMELLRGAGQAVENIFNGLDVDVAIKGFKDLGFEGKDLVDILIKCGMSSDDAAKKMAEFGTSGAKGVGKLGTAFTGLAAKIGISTTALGVLTGVLAGAALIFAGFKIYQQDLQKYVDSAKEAGSAWESSSEFLDGQISRLKEINNALKEGNLTEEESYAIKSELYSIQQNIADSYGKQADGIDLVNGKLEEEIHLLERINSQTANDFLNENVTGIKKANKEIEKSRSLFVGTFGTFGEDSKAIDTLIDKYGEYFTVVQDLYGQNKSVYFKGTAEQATEILGDFATDLRDLKSDLNVNDFADGLIEGVSKGINKAKGVLEEYQDLYDQARKAELYTDKEIYKFDGEEKTALKWISEYEKAVNDYNEALKSGDPSKITEASTALQKSAEAMNAASDGGVSIYSVYAEIINDIVSNLDQAAKAAHDFRDALGGNDNAIGRGIDQYAEQLKAIEITDVELKSSLDSEGLQRGEAAFRELINAAYDCKLITGKAPEDIQPLIDILIELGYVVGETASETQDANEKIVSSYDDAVKSVSDLKSELGAINGAISEQGYSGDLSVDTYNSLIAISKDYTACVEYQNGALQLNAEKANTLFEAKSELQKAEIELQKITEAAKWKENADEIARLTKEYDGLDPVIRDQIENLKKENDGIEANLVGYDLQIAAIEELTSAYGRWKAVSESDNSDSMYKDIQNAFKAIQEAQKTGQTGVGNIVYQAAVELLVPEGEDVKKYVSTLQRYITDGSNGLSNFINDMVSNGLMERTGTEVKMKMGVTMQEILDTMTLTPEMAKAIFNALEMYDFDFHWTDEDFNISTASVEEMQAELKRLQAEADATKAKIAELNEAGSAVDVSTGLSLEDYKKQLDAQVAAYDEVAKKLGTDTYDQAANKIEYTITVNTEDADTALDKIKSKLEEILEKVKDIFQKELGDLGGGDTLSILKNVLNTLRNINAYKIADKTFTVTQYTTTTGTKPYGSISSHDQNIKNDTSAHAAVASGTRHADAGIALVGDEYSPDGSPRPELIITDGAAYIAGQNGPEFVNLKDGDQVVPASETEKIIQRNPDVKRSVVPAFATGAGGYPAGSVQEDKYLEGVIGPDPTWLKQREEQKKKDDELIKQLSAKAAEKSADDTYLNNNAALNTNSTKKTYLNTSVTVGGGGNSDSLKNPGSGSGGSGGGGSGSGSSSSSSSSQKEKSQFEKDYEYRQHLLAMEKLDYEEYIDWLEDAYKEAYKKGEIELEDYRKYMEEVYEGEKQLFQDSIADIEHKIQGLQREPGNESKIISYYNKIIAKIDKEIAAAKARGLNDDDDYIQELIQQKWDYADEIKDIQDEITENAKDAVEDLIDYRIDMLKQDLENERDAVNDKLDTLRDFYDKQKEMLHDVYDEEKYLEEQSEKRKSVDDIRAEMDMLRFDDSAKAQKRLKELQEELKDAEKELADFEKDHALENATDLLDKMYEQQEAQIQNEIDAIEERLNDPNALYNQALRDIQNNTLALYEEMIKYNNKYGSGNPDDIFNMWSDADKSLDAYFKAMGESYKNILLVDAYKPTGYASGTSHATPGVHELFEGNKDEYVYTTKDGKRYRMFSGLGDKVLNASATDFLYKFANNGEAFISNMLNGLVGAISNVGKPAQQVQLSTGDIIIHGNATQETVSAIRRAQRENVDHILREFTRLNR